MTDQNDKTIGNKAREKRRKATDAIVDPNLVHARRVIGESRRDVRKPLISESLHRSLVAGFAALVTFGVLITAPFSPLTNLWPHAGLLFIFASFVMLTVCAVLMVVLRNHEVRRR